MSRPDVEIQRSTTQRGCWEIVTEQHLPRPLDEVFDFFSRAENLAAITPPWLKFEITTPTPIEMKKGALIDYKIRVHGIPIRWRTEITDWDPPRGFVDEQTKGPYRVWIHRHTFEARDDGTLVRDTIQYRPLGGALTNALIVKRDLRKIFAYRYQAIAERLS